ncbi:MAG: MATE family efflux transporter [Gemmatimonadota bacterium]
MTERAGSLRPLLRLALPIVGVNLGMMAMGAVDTIMVGRLSPEALAAVALGNVYFFALAMFGIGVLLAVDPILTQALGANDFSGAARAVQRGIVVAAGLSLPIAAALLVAAPTLRLAQQPATIIPLAGTYCLIMVPSVLPFLLFSVGRQTLQAMHRVGPVLWTIIAANLLNVGFNWLLIFGHLGFPALGVAGSAWATTLSRVSMLALLYLLAQPELRPWIRPWHPDSIRRAPIWAMLRLGIPIGFQIELEMAAFSIVALLMGTFGTVPVAGHQIALNLASLTFMVPMGVGMGVSVLVGQAVGRGDVEAVQRASRSALIVGAGFMGLTALLFLGLPRFLAQIYTTNEAVVAFAAMLLPIAGVFQVFDGLQVVSVGILRGLGDTRVPMLINLLGFGAAGIGASLYLAYRTPLGAVGLWWGLVIGLVIVAVTLMLRVRVATRRPLRRIAA